MDDEVINASGNSESSGQSTELVKFSKHNVGLSINSLKTTTENIQYALEIVDRFKNSSMIIKNFGVPATVGNKQVMVVDEGDVLVCLSLAESLHIDPIAALAMGRVFNKVGYLKAVTGVALGIDPLLSQTMFFGFESKEDGAIQVAMYTKTMNALAAHKGIVLTVLEDAVPVRYYADRQNNYIGCVLTDNMIVVPSNFDTLPEAEKSVITAKLNDPANIGCFFKGVTKRTTIKGTRTIMGETITEVRSYDLQEAVEAKLATGVKCDGTNVEGKANWNFPRDMLFTRACNRLHKVLSNDIFKNISGIDELMDSSNLKQITS